jgi:glycosyltransferase involved in cell wall biosynthesis
MKKNKHSLVVVTPVYEEVEAASRLFKELAAALGKHVYVVAVEDGSVRQPADPKIIVEAGLNGVLIKLKRNVGHQRAIAIGLNYVSDQLADAERVVVMDSDGEDVPMSIKELLKPLASEDIDVVVAQRRYRFETIFFKTFYLIYRIVFHLLTGQKINFGNFMVLKPHALKRLVAMQELWIHLAGSVLTSKLRITYCPLDRGPRYAGQSKMNFVGLALHGFKGLMVFAENVLVRVGTSCSFVATLSVVGIVTVIVFKVLGFTTPGWFSVVSGILFLVFLQMGALALMTLLLTGVLRSGGVANIDYKDFIDTILYATGQVKAGFLTSKSKSTNHEVL